MREIKFRGWCETDEGTEMIYFGQSEFDNGLWFDAPKHISEHYSIMQFTGLIDKNGKEIFDGDLVRWGCGFTGSYDTEIWHRYAIVELFPSLQFRIFKYFNTKENKFEKGDNHAFGYANFIYKDTSKYLEIIGNIHENPELL